MTYRVRSLIWMGYVTNFYELYERRNYYEEKIHTLGRDIALAFFALPSLAQADLVLNVDLTVTDQVTISALDGLSAGTVSASDTTGFYFENFYGAIGNSVAGNTTAGGDLTASLSDSDGGGALFTTASIFRT